MTQPEQVTRYQYVRRLALDFEQQAEGQVLSDADIDLIIATLADAMGNFNYLDVAIEYCRTAKYRNVEQVPERARAYRLREQVLLRQRMTADYANYATDGGATGINIGGGGSAVSLPLAWASLQPVNDLDSVGPADLQPTDQVILYDANQQEIVRMSLGAFDAYLQTAVSFGGITANAARELIAEWARNGNTGLVPVPKLPIASSSQSGIIGPDEFTRLLNSIDAGTLHDTPHLATTDLVDEDAFLLDDASINQGSQLREVRVDQLDLRWLRVAGAALPTTYIANEHILWDERFWRSESNSRFTIRLTTGVNPQAGDDDNGYRRGEYGNIDPDVSWIDALYWDDDDQQAKLVINTPTLNVGTVTVAISGGQGTLTFTGNNVNRSVAGTNLLFNADRTLAITTENPVLYWLQEYLKGDDVSLTVDNFKGNLSVNDTTVQRAMDTLDDLVISGGGQTGQQVAAAINAHAAEPNAHHSPPDTSTFVSNTTMTGAIAQHAAVADAHHTKTPAYTLPADLADWDRAITQNHVQVKGVVGQVAHTSARTLAQARTEQLGDFYQTGSRITNRYFILELTDEQFNQDVIRIGPTDGIGTPGSIVAQYRIKDDQNITHLGDNFYQFMLADMPAASAISVVDLNLQVNTNDIEFTPGLPVPTALINAPTAGLAIAVSSNDYFTSPNADDRVAFSATDNRDDFLLVDCEVEITMRGTATPSWRDTDPNLVIQSFTRLVAGERIAREGAYQSGQANGYDWASMDVRNGSAILGTLHLYLTRDGQQTVPWAIWRGNAGQLTWDFTFHYVIKKA